MQGEINEDINKWFFCFDKTGHSGLDVWIEDADEMYSVATAQLTLRIEAAEIDNGKRIDLVER